MPPLSHAAQPAFRRSRMPPSPRSVFPSCRLSACSFPHPFFVSVLPQVGMRVPQIVVLDTRRELVSRDGRSRFEKAQVEGLRVGSSLQGVISVCLKLQFAAPPFSKTRNYGTARVFAQKVRALRSGVMYLRALLGPGKLLDPAKLLESARRLGPTKEEVEGRPLFEECCVLGNKVC